MKEKMFDKRVFLDSMEDLKESLSLILALFLIGATVMGAGFFASLL